MQFADFLHQHFIDRESAYWRVEEVALWHVEAARSRDIAALSGVLVPFGTGLAVAVISMATWTAAPLLALLDKFSGWRWRVMILLQQLQAYMRRSRPAVDVRHAHLANSVISPQHCIQQANGHKTTPFNEIATSKLRSAGPSGTSRGMSCTLLSVMRIWSGTFREGR